MSDLHELAAPGPEHPRQAPSGQSGRFVRPARTYDLPLMGRVHAATMLASMEAAHAAAHEGAGLPEGVRSMIAAPVIAAGWEGPVTTPPSPEHHVLVSTEDGLVVGLIGVAPTQGLDEQGQPVEGSRAAEITALGVAADYQRRGHGSRLLAAAVDLARADGATALSAWAVRGDESLTGLLTAAGLTRTGAHRQLPIGEGVTEDCWAALI